MASFKALCLAGVASLAATASAYAADLPMPLPPPPPVYQPAPALGGNWYLRGDVGAGIPQINDSHSTFTQTPDDFAYAGADLNAQAIVGAGVGYRFNSFLRADVTGEYRFGGNYHAVETASGCNPGSTVNNCADQYGGRIHNGVVLVNGYVDLGTYYHVTPYVGAGVGAAFNQFSGLTDYNLLFNNAASGSAASSTNTQLAFAFMAGIAYDIAPNLKLDVGYRWIDMGRATSAPIVCQQAGGCFFERQSYRMTSNDIRIGLRYSLGDFAPVGPAPILVTKY